MPASGAAPVAGFGGALAFDGADDHVVIENHADLCMTDNYTIEAWIYPRTLGWLDGIVSKYNTSGSEGFTFRLSMNDPYTGINFDDVDTGAGYLEANKWNHVAGVNSNGTRRVYINGILRASTMGSYTTKSNEDAVLIGADFYPIESDRLFNGMIDEVRIWNAALEGSTISNWMCRGLDATHPQWASLVAYYKLNDGSGMTAADSTGGGHAGILSNMTAGAWMPSVTWEWSTPYMTPVAGCLVGSDADGASRDGADWALAFQVVSQGKKGAASISTNNAFEYTPQVGKVGSDSFSYRVSDTNANVSNVETVRVYIAGGEGVLVAWDFEGKAGNESAVTATVASAQFAPAVISRGPGSLGGVLADTFWSTNWPTSYTDTNYLEFSITPKPQYWFSPTSILVQTWLQYPGLSAEMYWRLRSDRDGYAGNLDEWYISNWSGTPSNVPHSVVLPSDFKDIRTTLVFRLYGHCGSTGPDGGLKGPGLDLAVYGQAGYGEPVYEGVLLTWDFTGNAGDEAMVAETDRHSNLLSSVVSRGPGLDASPRADSFNSTNWNYNVNNDYVEFPVIPKPGYIYSITGFTFSTYCGQYAGFDWWVRSDRDGFGNNIDSWYQGSSTIEVRQVSATTPNLIGVVTTTVFRLYGSNWSGGPDVALQDFSNNPAVIVWGQLWFDGAGDVDGDGMPNAWERTGTGTATGAVRGLDFDGDRVTDDQEWIADTNPGDSNSFLSVRRIAIASPATMSFSSSVDRVYTLQNNGQLVTGAWDDVSGQVNIPGTGGQMSLTDTNELVPKKFYRIEATMP